MTPQAWIAVVGVAVALGTFLLGRASKRWTDQGASDAKTATLKEISDKLQAEVARIGQHLAALEQAGISDEGTRVRLDRLFEEVAEHRAQIAALDRALDERYDSTKKIHLRVDKLAHDVTVVRTALGMEETGKHFIEPFRGGSGGGSGEDST